MSLGKGNRRNRRQPQTTSIETTRSTAPAFVQNQIQQTFREAQAQQPLVYTGPRVAESNRDQDRFFDMTRDFVERTQNEPLPTIDTSNLEALQGRAINTSGIMGMLGRQADVGQLQGMIGSRVDTSELAGLMGQQNIANPIFQDFTTREVTPYLETAVDDAASRALQNVNNLYAGSGRLGSTAFADAAARGVTAASAPLLQQAAQTDAARQLQAAGLLGQAFQQDRAADIGLATTRAGFDQSGMQLDAQLANQITGYEDAMLARDLAAQQSMLQAEQADMARELSIAQGLTGASETQARLAPQMQQMQLQSLGMLGAIGDAQQAQQQAELEARRQQIAELNAARQMRMQNMINASQLGSQFKTSTTTTQTTPEQQQGGGLLNTLGGLAAGYIGLGAPGLEMVPVIGAPLKAASLAAAPLMFGRR